jgi:tetratricopeptide (TPR) repeat protein
VTYADGIVGLADHLPGLPSGESRLDLAVNTAKLIGDYPFTGGGLRSFPGLYSQYIMVIPNLLFSYSHNFYLDVIIEQGWLGGLGLMIIFLGSGWILFRRLASNRENSQVTLASEAILIGLIVILFHGLVDDALYGEQGSPLLLFMPGLALMLVYSERTINPVVNKYRKLNGTGKEVKSSLNRRVIANLLIVAIAVVIIIINKPLFASWYANLGAVEMSRQELKGFPSQRRDGSDEIELAQAVTYLSYANGLDPNNQTANHRMGLIAFDNREFPHAQEYLSRAYDVNPKHRGIIKSLGYTYTWLGQFDNAAQLLINIPEAKYEMDVYSWWWGTQGREDLAKQAEVMAMMLED